MFGSVENALARRAVRWALVLILPLLSAVALGPAVAYAGTITVDGTFCTLPDAIIAANADATFNGCEDDGVGGADTLMLTAANYALTSGPFDHDGDTATPSVTSEIVIDGGSDGAVIARTGGGLFRLFHVSGDGDLTLQNVTLRDGHSTANGGAIYSLGHLTLVDSELSHNHADIDGGAIGAFGNSTVRLTNTRVLTNTAASDGAGLYMDASHATLEDSFLAGNVTGENGAGLYGIFNSTITVSRTVVFANTSQTDDGGGLMVYYGSSLSVFDSTVISNSAASNGGGLYSDGGPADSVNAMTVVNTRVEGNRTDEMGGGIYVRRTTTTISGTEVLSNTAQRGGGFGSDVDSTTVLTHGVVDFNLAQSDGGGIYIVDSSLDAAETRLDGNQADVGGGVYLYSGQAIIDRSHLLSNQAQNGGALYKRAGTITIGQSCIVNNADVAVSTGGGVDIEATENWWGAENGPSGEGTGFGDSVGTGVVFTPFLTSVIFDCPALASNGSLYIPYLAR